MALYNVGERVKLRSGRVATIRRVLLDSPMPTNARYQVAMEPGIQLIGINGLDIIERLPSVEHLPPNARNASLGLGVKAFQQWPNMHRVLLDIDEIMVLSRVKYVLQGSAAAVLHGASISKPPGDLDICVDNLLSASQALNPPQFQPAGGSFAVKKFCHATGVDVDIVMAAEFGVNIDRRSSIQGAWVLSLTETLCSILRRPEIREKEIEAFNSLILLKGNALTSIDKQAVVKAVTTFTKGQTTSWGGIVEMAKAANTKFKWGIH